MGTKEGKQHQQEQKARATAHAKTEEKGEEKKTIDKKTITKKKKDKESVQNCDLLTAPSTSLIESSVVLSCVGCKAIVLRVPVDEVPAYNNNIKNKICG